MAVEVLGTGNDDGTTFGRSTDKLSFYGATPVVKPTISADAGTDAATLVVELTELRALLVTMGLIVS